MKIGDQASSVYTISEDDINLFANVSRDYNPIHLDEEYAAGTIFKKRIAHGMLLTSFISSVLGTKLPGEGSIYLNQMVNFIKPAFIDDEIKVSVTISEISGRKVTLLTTCVNQKSEIVIDGKAILLLPKV